MRKLWVVIKREYLERVRTKWFVVATIFGPILFGALLFLPAYLATRDKPSVDVARIAILDATGTDLGERIASELNGGVMGDTSLTQLVEVSPDSLAAAEMTATRAVQTRRLKGYLVLGRGILSGGGARYSGTNATSIADVARLQDVIEHQLLALMLRQAGVSSSTAESFARNRVILRADRLSPSGRGGSGRISIIFAIVVGMLLYMTILMYGQNVLRGVIEEKQSRVAEVVISSVRPTTLLAGKVLGVGAVGLTQLLLWMAATFMMLRFRVAMLRQFGIEATPIPMPSITPSALIVLLIFFLLGYTLYSAMFATVGAMVSSEQEAQQAQLPVVMLLVVSIMFLQPVLSAPDGNLALTLALIPVSAPIVMPLRMSAVDVPVWEIGLSLLTLLAACYLAVYVAARVYHTGLLMYGKRVTVREMLRWVRASR